MMLLTKANRKSLPPLYAQDGFGDAAVAYVKFFDPAGSWDWYATEFDGADTFFGLVIGWEAELGYFSLGELESAVGLTGLGIERDMYWKPQTLREVKALLGIGTPVSSAR